MKRDTLARNLALGFRGRVLQVGWELPPLFDGWVNEYWRQKD